MKLRFGGSIGASFLLLSASIGATSYSIVHNFQIAPTNPNGGVVADATGRLYGFSSASSAPVGPDFGTVYVVNGDGSGFSVLHAFSCLDPGGWRPIGPPVLDGKGRLYGTTESAVFSMNLDGSEYTILHTYLEDGDLADGIGAMAPVILDGSGTLFGTTNGLGTGLGGTIFTLNTDGTGFGVLHSFSGGSTDGLNPRAALCLDGSGTLFGTTTLGGADNAGTIFTVRNDGTAFSVIYSFPNPAPAPYSYSSIPSRLVGDGNGNLYGTTYFSQGGDGTVFTIRGNGAGFSTLHTFSAPGLEGLKPFGGVVLDARGFLYGTTASGGSLPTNTESPSGTVFKMAVNGGSFVILHTFNSSDGSGPDSAPIFVSPGRLVGTTSSGGYSDAIPISPLDGTLFSLNSDGTDFSFYPLFVPNALEGDGPTGELLFDGSGTFYGLTQKGGVLGEGTAYRIDVDGSGFSKIHDFASQGTPTGALALDSDGNLYGVTDRYVFKLTARRFNYSTLHEFGGGLDGLEPEGGVVLDDSGFLYGTTSLTSIPGGAKLGGIVYRVGTDGQDFSVLHQFLENPGEAFTPTASLVLGNNNNLYGTTSQGGLNGGGTVFTLKTDGSNFKILHSFSGFDGETPNAPLVLDGNGYLYGTTTAGGTAAQGTAFRLKIDGNDFSVLHSFDYPGPNQVFAGVQPRSPLVLDGNGNIFGAAYGTGEECSGGNGTVFSMTTSGGRFSTIHVFSGAPSDGDHPGGGLTFDRSGNLFGTTVFGGPGGVGIIFALSPPFTDQVPRWAVSLSTFPVSTLVPISGR